MKKTMKRMAALALALVMALSIVVIGNPTDASAAKTNKVTANTTDNYKKAPALKTGNNLVTVKITKSSRARGLVKYTAKKKGTYVITVSGMNGYDKPDINLGNYYIKKLKKSGSFAYLDKVKVKTNKGKTDWLKLATKYSYNNFYKSKGQGTSNYLYKRTATISLKKGESIYIDTYCTTSKKKYTYNVNIKLK